MAAKLARAVIVGATSPLGKELAEQLNAATQRVWEIRLADAEDAGQMTAAGDEALVVQPLTPESFEKADVVFFAGNAKTTREHWKSAQAAGAAIVDLSGELDVKDGAVLLVPGLLAAQADLTTSVTATAHPAALMLARLLQDLPPDARVTATVLLPASIFGGKAMDELQAQTVALLSFQSVPTEVFGTQTAFTLRDALGAEAQADFARESIRVLDDTTRLLPKNAPTVQVLLAPVFHGVSASVFVDLSFVMDFDAAAWQASFSSSEVQWIKGEEEASNYAINAEGKILARASEVSQPRRGLWLWTIADNLQVSAISALRNAEELLHLRPTTKLQ